MKKILHIVLCFVGFSTFSQTEKPDTNQVQTKHPYQSLSLGEAINTTEYAELNPVISPDGNILYFERLNHPENNYGVHGSQDIWYSEKDSYGEWMQAKRMPNNVNSARYNVVFSVLDNGYTLLVSGVYSKNGKWKKRGLSETHKVADYWSNPKAIKVKGLQRKNKGQAFDAFMSVDKKVLMMSFSKHLNRKKTDLFVSIKKEGKNKWSSPKKVKPMKHASSIEQAPCISPDGDTLYFSTNYSFDDFPSGGKKDYSIYYCVRKDESFRHWTQPKYLDKNINTDKYESDFMIDNTGEIAYFVSDFKGSADIYSVRLFENEPYVLLKGQVMNMFKNAPLEKEASYKIVIRQKVISSPEDYEKGIQNLPTEEALEVDTIMQGEELSSFIVKLPFGKVYELEVESQNFNTAPIIIDTYKDNEHRIVNQNLFVKPLDYALVKGTILDKKNNLVLVDSLMKKISISVNGLAYDSALVNADGTYEMKLSLREKYDIQANLEGYNSIQATVDLSGYENFTTIEQSLYLKKQEDNFAYVKASIFTKDEKSFTKEYTLFLNDKKYTDFIEKSTNQFYVKLALDKLYELRIEAKDHIRVYDSLNFVGQKERIELTPKFYLTEIKVGEKVKLDHIYFDLGKATLQASSFNELDHVVSLLKDHPTMKIEIGGHTDNKGSAKFNTKLSNNRAKSVAEYLVSKGIDLKRVTSKGYGFEKPVATNDTEFGRQQNRRVEFTILEK